MSLGTIPKFPMLLTLLSLLLLLFDLSALKTEVTVISTFTKLPTFLHTPSSLYSLPLNIHGYDFSYPRVS